MGHHTDEILLNLILDATNIKLLHGVISHLSFVQEIPRALFDVISFFAHATARLGRGMYQKLFKSIQTTPIDEMMIGIT
ncbi:hypothetical protein LC653_17930 [Nostoc sp. CHAB 5784]|nr:hypothetical protein [Nostoc mirabile CHAB5784]